MKGIESKLLLVQCESADENSELLDSVRFIIQRESEGARGTTHTVLLLNLPRGRQFTGYQGQSILINIFYLTRYNVDTYLIGQRSAVLVL